jgi:hypothetical protein
VYEKLLEEDADDVFKKFDRNLDGKISWWDPWAISYLPTRRLHGPYASAIALEPYILGIALGHGQTP